VVAVSALSLILGYAIVLGAYHLENRVPLRQLAPRDGGWIVLASVAGLLIFLPYFRRTDTHALVSVRMAGGLLAALLMIVILPMWVHPMRKRLWTWVFSRLPASFRCDADKSGESDFVGIRGAGADCGARGDLRRLFACGKARDGLR
jgi:hypothetical protein